MNSLTAQVKATGLLPLDVNQIMSVFDELIEAIYGVDLNGKCTFCNKTLLRLTKYDKRKQMLGQNMHQLLHHSKEDGTPRASGNFGLWQCLTQGKIIHEAKEVIWCQDGSSLPVELWGYPFYKNGRVDGAIIAFVDIRARVYAQQALENSLERYRSVLESTQIIPWEYDVQTERFTFISPHAEVMFGHPLTEWYQRGFWERHLHPDDKEKTIRACEYGVTTKENFQLEYRMLKGDGRPIYVNDFVSVVTKGDRVTGLRGVFTDISLNKMQEEQLRLAAVTFDTDAGIFITDKDGLIVKVNKAFSDITGYEEHEVLDQSPSLFKSDRYPESFFRTMWADISHHGRWRGEIWNKNASGDDYPQWLTITAVRNAEHQITHYVAVFTDISEIKAAEEKIKFQSHFDPVTELPNRVFLANSLQQAIRQARKFHHHGALLLIDLDEFKVINDSLGHDFGDKLLNHVGHLLAEELSRGDLVARLGGDEFAVLLPDLGGDASESQRNVAELCARLCEKLFKTNQVEGVPIHMSASIGFSIFSNKRVSESDVLKQADTAMYKAKQSGKNCVVGFTQDMQAEANKRLTIQGELKLAIEQNQLELHYQPQFDSKGKLSGMEALVRWNHPSKGRISPNEFIPIAEKSGLIIPLGCWVIEKACATLAAWSEKYEKPLPRIAINVSAQQFHQASFVEMVKQCLKANRLTPQDIELEITEEVLIGDVDATVEIIGVLRKLGISFAIDDFGTGYSSLTYLKKLPINMLKIDRSFIVDVLTNKDDEAIAQTILAMAKHLGLKVVAEGIETEAQFAWLNVRDCDYYQGFYFSRPLNRLDFEQQILDKL